MFCRHIVHNGKKGKTCEMLKLNYERKEIIQKHKLVTSEKLG